jgi:hypothetical protein
MKAAEIAKIMNKLLDLNKIEVHAAYLHSCTRPAFVSRQTGSVSLGLTLRLPAGRMMRDRVTHAYNEREVPLTQIEIAA